MTTRERDVRVADGRVLRVLDTGPADGHALFVLHGSPASRLLHDSWLAAAEDAEVRLLSYDRPGYGGSSPRPDRTIADTATDVAVIAEELRVDRFAVWGASGGGAHALACAALPPDRVVAAAVVTSLAPYDAPGLDWFAGMAEAAAQNPRLALVGRDALEPVGAQVAEAVKVIDPAQLLAVFEPMLSPPDRATFDLKLAAAVLADWREALAAGGEGLVEDYLAVVAPWGVDLGSVRVPVTLWWGEQDRVIPPPHGRWLAGVIPGAQLRLFPDDGHFSLLFGRDREVIAWLAERLRRGR
jgi:pimeloyl-ACP methyl ester carboxylesterase